MCKNFSQIGPLEIEFLTQTTHILNSISYYWVVPLSGCINLHFHHSSYPLPYFSLPDELMFFHMLDMKWYLLLLICIFLITRKIKNLFIFYWLLVFISCNLKTHIVFAHFLLGYLLLINIKTKQSLILCHLYRWKIPSDAFNLFFYLSCQFHFKCHF